MKNQWKILGCVFLMVFFMMLMGADAAEKDFPNKPLELIVPFAAGGSTDVMARAMVARAASFFNNQPILVVNKPGAGTVAGSRYVLDGKNDGYTLYSASMSSLQVAPIMHKTNFTYKDFIGLAQVLWGGDAFYVKADLLYNTMEKFIEYAKQNPGKIKYTTAGAGSVPHLVMEGFAAATGIVIKHIPTKGDVEAATSILGGHVSAAAGNPITFKPYEEAGKIKSLAQFCGEREKIFLPHTPTFKEQGIDVVLDQRRWVVVPKGVPPNLVRILADNLKNLLHDKATLESLEKIQCPVYYLPPEQYERVMKESETTLSSLFKLAGLK